MSFPINQQRLLNTFLDIVQIDSPSGHETAMTKNISERLSAMNIESVIDDAGNVIANIPGEGPALLLNAHLDTVEPGRGVQPIIEDGIIKSSGDTILGADNKAAVAALLEALCVLKEQQTTHPPLDIVFTVSEEVANNGAIALDYSKIQAKHGYTFDSGDPVGTITIASPYYNRFDIEITGTAAHASRPEQASNVLPVLQEALSAVQLGRISDNTVCNIGMIAAGHARNTIPGNVTIRGEVRSFYESELHSVTNNIINTFTSVATQQKMEIRHDVVMENEGYVFLEDDEFVQYTVRAVEKTGYTSVLKRSSECYDANIFNSNGIRVLNIANGAQHMHTVNEQIAITELEYLANTMLFCIKDFSI